MAQSLDEMLVEKADHHYKTFWHAMIRVWKALRGGLCFLRYKMNLVKSLCMINDSLAHTLFANHKHFSNSQLTLSHAWDDGGLRRSTTFLTAIEIRIVRTNWLLKSTIEKGPRVRGDI